MMISNFTIPAGFSEKAGFNKFFPEIIYPELIPLCIG